MPAPRQFDPDEVIRLRLSGLSQKQVAAQLGCSEALVSKVCKRAGVRVYINPWISRRRKSGEPDPESPELPAKPDPAHPRTERVAALIPQVVKKYQAGQSLDAVAQAHGLSAETVRSILQDEGVEIRSRGVQKKSVMNSPYRLAQSYIEESLEKPLISRCAKCGFTVEAVARTALEAFRRHACAVAA